MTFTTKSGSVYQVLAESKRIRQIKGTSTRFGDAWFDFLEIFVLPGRRAFVLCPNDYIVQTSQVVSVVPCLN